MKFSFFIKELNEDKTDQTREQDKINECDRMGIWLDIKPEGIKGRVTAID